MTVSAGGTPTANSNKNPAFLIQLPEDARPKIDQYRLRVQCSVYAWVPIITDVTVATSNTKFLYEDNGGTLTLQSRIVGAAATDSNSIKKVGSYYREFVIQVVQSSEMKEDVDVQRGKYAPQNFFTWSPCATPDKQDCIPSDA